MSDFLPDGPIRIPASQRTALVAALAGLLVLAAASHGLGDARPAPPNVAALLARFRTVPGLDATFHEEKSVALLRDPLVSDGRLYFLPPSKLARHVTAPIASSMVLDGDDLRLGDATSSERLDLRAHPEARVFVEAFRAVLAGDEAALRRSFDVRYAARPDGTWSLDLAPRDASVRRILRAVHMTGADIVLATLDVEEASGDVSRTRFTRVDSRRRFSRAEERRLFRVGGR